MRQAPMQVRKRFNRMNQARGTPPVYRCEMPLLAVERAVEG